jgi:hypothetical protein
MLKAINRLILFYLLDVPIACDIQVPTLVSGGREDAYNQKIAETDTEVA